MAGELNFLEGDEAYQAVAKALPVDSTSALFSIHSDAGNRMRDNVIEFIVKKMPRHGRDEFSIFQAGMLDDGRVVVSKIRDWVAA